MKGLVLVILATFVGFLNGEYNFVTTKLTMAEARKNCQQWGGDLVTVRDGKQNNYIFNEMKTRKLNSVWIGYNDIQQEGKFQWVDHSNSMYTNWDRNEPNDMRGSEDCTELMVSRSGRWNDQTCTDKVASVCYKAAANEAEYKFVTTKMTMTQAYENCLSLGSMLVTVQNKAQNDYILSEMKTRRIGSVWIGFNDIKEEGKFEWVDSNACSKYTNWDRNEPNDMRGSEDCTELMVSRGGRWNDQTCSDKIASVCYKAGGFVAEVADPEVVDNEDDILNTEDTPADPEVEDNEDDILNIEDTLESDSSDDTEEE